jgi:hypothetical protein
MLICLCQAPSAGPIEWATLIAALVGASGIIWAALTYDRDSKHKRAIWLGELFEKFYVKQDYKRVRRLMDEGRLEAEMRTGNKDYQTKLEESIVDYLNFFEFIGSLHEMNQLSRQEIDMMFDYYLRVMKKPENYSFLRQEHLKYGFERLSKLLEQTPGA